MSDSSTSQKDPAKAVDHIVIGMPPAHVFEKIPAKLLQPPVLILFERREMALRAVVDDACGLAAKFRYFSTAVQREDWESLCGPVGNGERQIDV